MNTLRATIASLAIMLLAPASAEASIYFTGDVTKVAANLYEGPSGVLVNTVGCAQPAAATPAVVRIDANTGAIIGRITFGGGPGCDIAAVYAPYVDAPAGTYAAVLTSFDTGYYADTTVEPYWIVRGAPTCPSASGTPSWVTLAATGPTYLPPGTTPVGTIILSPGASQQSCPLVGIFGKVDLSTITAYTLSVTKAGPGTGTVTSDPLAIDCGLTCSAHFGPDTSVTLTATPSAGSTFAGWSGACSGPGTCSVTMTDAADVTATFLVEAPSTFSLSVSKGGTGTGTVSSSPGGINCGATCSANFSANVPVTLSATADGGSSFAGWSGAGCSGTGQCVVPMSAAANVTATFDVVTPVTFPLTVTRVGTGSGSVTSTPAGIVCGATCSNEFNSGQVVALSALADAGSIFAGWSGACAGTGACNVTMDAARSVTATFANAAPATFTLTVNRAGTGSGSVASATPGINCGTTCSASFSARTVVTLTATAATGSSFSGWSGAGCSGSGTCSVTMDAARTVTATFALQPFALSVTKAGGGAGTVTSSPAGINCGATCTTNFSPGTAVALTATAGAGSFFAGWTGACTGTGACNVTMDAAKSVGAQFKLNTTIPRLANIATRMQVLTGADVLIGGFIIGGSQAKTVVVRARGPSLTAAGVPGALQNPLLQLFSGQTVIAANDDWQQAGNAAALQTSGFAPADPKESAILITLGPGAYTAIVSGVGNTTGVGIVEVFEVDLPQVPLINIATRGQVLTAADVMIGGFIIQGDAPQTVIVRARGPSLTAAGVPGALQDPVLQLFSGQTQIGINDDWQTDANAGQIQSRGFAPSDARESAILVTLPPGAYTAIVTGKNGTTGVGIIEVFAQ